MTKNKSFDSLSSISDDQTSENSENSNNDISINHAVDPLTFFNSKELCYYRTIHKFFKTCNDENIIKMLDIINGTSEISLRLLDWFVTKYSKKKIDFNSSNEHTIDSFDVHISYKSELKSYKKKYFDPFRRRRKFFYPLYLNEKHYTTNNTNNSNNSKETVLLYTTLGQLNFFMWIFSNNILAYVELNLNKIIEAMNTTNRDDKKKKKQKLLINKNKTYNNNNEISNLNNNKCKSNNVFTDYYNTFTDNKIILNFD
jgi:hypothetical protein